jgi:dTDP-4-amino-4,6-dideoxygalactose transaminase
MYRGKPVGSYADMTCFSFFPTKAIAVGEGGMVTTNNENYYHALKEFRDHGRRNGVVVDVGENLRISDINCALGITQLKKLPMFIERRREIAYKYCQAFKMKFYPNHAYHLFVIQVKDRDDIRLKLTEMGVPTQIHYYPLHLHPYYRGVMGDYPVAEGYWRQCVSIPLFPKMTNDDVDLVIESVKRACGY